MSEEYLAAGNLVKILKQGWAGSVGIVTRPVGEQKPGHVLFLDEGSIMGMDACLDDVAPIDEESEGFAQLGYHLIKLGSHVIEQKLIVYRS